MKTGDLILTFLAVVILTFLAVAAGTVIGNISIEEKKKSETVITAKEKSKASHKTRVLTVHTTGKEIIFNCDGVTR